MCATTAAIFRKPAPLICLLLSNLMLTPRSVYRGQLAQPAHPLSPALAKQLPNSQTPDGFAIQTVVSLVVLQAAVFDQRGKFIPGLPQQNFVVYENHVKQTIALFHQEDAPVTMGLVIDNSESMRDKVESVNTAALALVKSSHPLDEAFVVNFSDAYRVVQDFTSDTSQMKEAIEQINSRGLTALYDAIIGSLDHLKQGNKDRRVLIVITDGADNSSRSSIQLAIASAHRADALIYAVGLFSKDDLKNKKSELKRARHALVDLATVTGGLAFFPNTPAEIGTTCAQIARDIRERYTIGYYPTNVPKDGSFHTLQLMVIPPPGYGRLSVRARTGYFAGRN